MSDAAGWRSSTRVESETEPMTDHEALVKLVKFDSKGLVPAVVQDVATGDVLMLAYMNAESLRRTLRDGRTCFWSRSRQEFWVKGETSGHVQKVSWLRVDCDADTLVVAVEQTGAACHNGTRSCFVRESLPTNDLC